MVIRKTILSVTLAGVGLLNAGFANAVAVSGQGTWEATLQGRDLDGNLATFEAYYDTALNITWLADANYANSSGYITIGASGGPNAYGVMTWANAMNWAAGLNINGITGWRLPTVTDAGTPGCDWDLNGTDCGYNVNVATGEMARMFYETLGNQAFYNTSGVPQAGYGLTNTGPFSNIEPTVYWSATELATDTFSTSWYFNFGLGGQDRRNKAYDGYAWAVHSGDVGASTVPVPAAVWLLGSGLAGLIGVARRRK